MGIPVTGVSELVLEVVDLEASEAFYAGALGLPVVDRWPDREAIWVMAGDRTRIGLWRPQVGLQGSRGGVHVHFALHIAEADYDSADRDAARGRPRRPRARVQDPPALALRLRQRPRRPPRRALDLGRRRPRQKLAAQSKRSRSGPPVRAVASTSRLWTLICLPAPPNFQPPRTLSRRRRASRPRPRRRCARPCRAWRSGAARRRRARAMLAGHGSRVSSSGCAIARFAGIAQVEPHQRCRRERSPWSLASTRAERDLARPVAAERVLDEPLLAAVPGHRRE